MHILGLRNRLTTKPSATNSFAYHVTHGVRLSSIKRSGLVAGKPGVQYKTNHVFYGTNLHSLYSAYGTTIVSPLERKVGSVAYSYFQGVCVLRTSLTRLVQLGFNQANGNDWIGPGVAPADLELFIDGKWQSLQSVDLGFAHAIWRTLYDVTPFLRTYIAR